MVVVTEKCKAHYKDENRVDEGYTKHQKKQLNHQLFFNYF